MMLRSFIAIELPAEIQQAITRATADLQAALPRPLIRWVAPQNIHLTLKFLGDVSPGNLERLADVLRLEAKTHAAFRAAVGGLGVFPNPRRPRVIWVGFEAPADLARLQHSVEAVCARLGYPPEGRAFSPHLTLGRVAQTASAADLERIRQSLQTAAVAPLGNFLVEALHIFKSDLQPGGSVYTRLYSLPLQAIPPTPIP
ncbi:MAG: RNA 2',3'-cyclic phosphodiesterase [Anaerolineales bacterium]